MSFTVGARILDRYELREELGRGAMGVVYRAYDTQLERDLAIKTVRSDVVASHEDVAGYRARFRREAQSAARLNHPNIVTVFDVGEHDGTLFMALEYLDGGTLEERLRAQPVLALDECLRIAIQVCKGLEVAHQGGVFHRDIKPANIMLNAKGRVTITDFGIAKVETSSALTREGLIVGTPSFMSPEQLRGHEIDHRSDQFSVGTVLYEMVTGRRAFHADNVTTVILKVVTEQPRSPRETHPDVPSDLVTIIERAMAKDREHRFASMAEMMAALEALARPARYPSVSVATVRTEATATAATATPPEEAAAEPSQSSATSSVTPTAATSAEASAPEPTPSTAPRPTASTWRRPNRALMIGLAAAAIAAIGLVASMTTGPSSEEDGVSRRPPPEVSPTPDDVVIGSTEAVDATATPSPSPSTRESTTPRARPAETKLKSTAPKASTPRDLVTPPPQPTRPVVAAADVDAPTVIEDGPCGPLAPLAQLSVAPVLTKQPGPQISGRVRRGGVTELTVLVDWRGRVCEAKVLRSEVPRHRSAVLASVKDYEFVPGQIDGKPVGTWITLSVNLKAN